MCSVLFFLNIDSLRLLNRARAALCQAGGPAFNFQFQQYVQLLVALFLCVCVCVCVWRNSLTDTTDAFFSTVRIGLLATLYFMSYLLSCVEV